MPDLPNEDREKRYVATGPNEGDSVRGITGFYTDAVGLDFGVNAQGHECGVYGESVDILPETNRRPQTELDGIIKGAGVYGVGLNYGVIGKGFTTAGVYGENHSSGAGVYGKATALDSGATGVVGIGKISHKEDKALAGGVGVVGAVEGAHGFGVVGLSVESLIVTTPTTVPRRETRGASGTGVFGASGIGTGVHGLSVHGRGGKFEPIELAAQVQLVPVIQKTLDPQLPKDGRVGDLLMIRNIAENEDEKGTTLEDHCSLWLCVPRLGQFGNEDSDQWQRITLGNLVTGTL